MTADKGADSAWITGAARDAVWTALEPKSQETCLSWGGNVETVFQGLKQEKQEETHRIILWAETRRKHFRNMC